MSSLARCPNRDSKDSLDRPTEKATYLLLKLTIGDGRERE